MDRAAEIQQRYQIVQANIASTVTRYGRNPEDIRLIGVSKKQPIEKISAYIIAGGTILGENYPEEGAGKIEALAGLNAEWHMVGHIQSRKAALVASHFDYIHSLDSFKLASKLQTALAEQDKRLHCLIEINIGAEANKSGYLIQTDAELGKLWLDLDRIILLPESDLERNHDHASLFFRCGKIETLFHPGERVPGYPTKEVSHAHPGSTFHGNQPGLHNCH